MSGTGTIPAPRAPLAAARSPFDICECGDYRHDHEGGEGACTLPPDTMPGFKPCRRFRLALASKARAQA
ncbi:hypothetical protein [Croceibacterium aestuarii]|uniref:hypothetical protein n=1 Tax=Croceibacterium aestuarii TaxID=3064139 RepID=UPI00272E0830|nr:hypothetical protein [Croceibacterium sp. D39]